MATVKAILWKHQQNKDGTYPLRIRITKEGRAKYMSLGYSLKLTDFDEQGGKVKTSFPNAARLNNLIAKRVSEVQSAALELESEDSDTTLRQIKRKIKEPPKKDFFTFSASYIQKFNNQNQIGTYKKYKSKLQKFHTFLRGERIRFNDIDPEMLRDYETHLKGIGNGVNTIHGDMRAIRSFYYAAIREGVANQSKNPFFSYKLVSKKSRKERLTVQELNRIRALELKEKSNIWDARNVFLFSFNTMGMRIGDVMTLRWLNIHDNRVDYQMKKTGDVKSIKLSPEAEKILNYYRADKIKPSDFIFPLVNPKSANLYNAKNSANVLANKYLRNIAEQAGILKKLSCHIARHTWAQFAKNNDVELRMIQKGLGHESSKTTEIYLDDLNDIDMDETNLRILRESR